MPTAASTAASCSPRRAAERVTAAALAAYPGHPIPDPAMNRFHTLLRAPLLMLVLGLSGGTVAGAGAMLVAFPFLFPPPAAADAAPPTPAAREGRFVVDAPSRDRWHWADGSASLHRDAEGWVLRLDDDFRAGPGPDFHVYLNRAGTGTEAAFLADGDRRLVARLRAFEGGQNYRLPNGFEPDDLHAVTIWCEEFGEYIGHAVLAPPERLSRRT